MSHADPLIDADQRNDALYAEQDAKDAAEQALIDEITAAVAVGDMAAPIYLAPTIPVRVATLTGSKVAGKRFQTVAEVLFNSLDFTDGPTFAEVMTLAAKAPESKPFFKRMAQQFASLHGAHLS